jgi:hypothetical protein
MRKILELCNYICAHLGPITGTYMGGYTWRYYMAIIHLHVYYSNRRTASTPVDNGRADTPEGGGRADTPGRYSTMITGAHAYAMGRTGVKLHMVTYGTYGRSPGGIFFF